MGKSTHKHSKPKNIAIIWECLLTEVRKDFLEGRAIKYEKILRKYFHANSPLREELGLYASLLDSDNVGMNEAQLYDLISITQKRHKELAEKHDIQKLRYNLIQEVLKTKTSLQEFFQAPISDYKEMATAYFLLEHGSQLSPRDTVKYKGVLQEYHSKPDLNPSITEFVKQPKHMRLLTMKSLLHTLNESMKEMSPEQRNLITLFLGGKEEPLREAMTTMVADNFKSLDEAKISDKALVLKIKNLKETFNDICEGTISEEKIKGVMRLDSLTKSLIK